MKSEAFPRHEQLTLVKGNMKSAGKSNKNPNKISTNCDSKTDEASNDEQKTKTEK